MNQIISATNSSAAAISEFASLPYSVLVAVASLLIGFAMGLAYFGGLWFTVRDVTKHPHRVGLIFVSGVSRLAVAGFAFYLISSQGAMSVLAAVVGMWIARWALVRRLGGCCRGQ